MYALLLSALLLLLPSGPSGEQGGSPCCQPPCHCCATCECSGVSWDVEVVRVKDGDTIVVKKGENSYDVRMVGVDTPESVDTKRGVQPYGPEASAHTKKALTGKTVHLQFVRGKVEKDHFGRLVAIVFLDGVEYNLALVEEGYGRVYTKFPLPADLKHRYAAAEAAAKADGRGLWGLPAE